MGTNVPDTLEIYMICYITMRGWSLVDGRWEKEGCKRNLTYNEKESNDYMTRNKMSPRYLGQDFLLEDAYNRELYSSTPQEVVMATHIAYNTGDQIWYIKIGDKILVTRVITHDGITWVIGDKSLSFKENK
jgi:hypothetical protein